jgi:hypothetical protein
VLVHTGVAQARPLSEKDWRKQANAICKQIDTDLEAAADEALAELDPNTEPTAEQLAVYLREFIPVMRGGITSIAALEEPAALRKDVKRLKASVLLALAVLERDPANDEEDLFDEAARITKKLGLKACT